jgi:diguanylate cyclase (GGDEF)-like protein
MRNILLVDSDAFARRVFSRTLTRRGYGVVACATHDEALKLTYGVTVEVIVTDTRLPTGAGNLIRDFRSNGFSGPTIVITSIFEPAAVGTEVTLLLHRPISPADLAFEVEQLISPETLEISSGQSEAEWVPEDCAARVSDLLAQMDDAAATRDVFKLRDHLVVALEDAKTSGLVRVGQALARAQFAMGTLVERDSQEAWKQVIQALDDAHLATGNGAPSEGLRFAICTRDRLLRESIIPIAREHLFEIEEIAPERLLTRVSAEKFDGIFLDLDLRPEVDVTSLVGLLRARQASQAIPVSFLCAGTRLEHRVEAAVAGATRFIQKPISTVDFVDAAQHMASLVRAGKPRVLIIDPDPKFGAETTRTMSSEGFNAWHAENVRNIFDLLEQFDPDVVLLAVSFPDLSGLDVCRMLRTSPRWSDLPVLMVSEHYGPRSRIAAYKAGADDVLSKPLLREELMARLRVRIDRIRLTRERADRDSLTGLLTRRAFMERISQRLAEARRNGRPLTLCLIDLDHFKLVNDTHGHAAGDQVLAQLGRLMTERFRVEDLRCRWGGEEFAIAFVDEDLRTARSVLQRVLEEFSRVDFGLDDSGSFHVTFSGGLAEFGPDGQKFDELVRIADERLYVSKESGRNRITP